MAPREKQFLNFPAYSLLYIGLMPLGSPQSSGLENARDKPDRNRASTELVPPPAECKADSSRSEASAGSTLGVNDISDIDFQSTVIDEGLRSPLVRRSGNLDLLHPEGSLPRPNKHARPNLQSSTTTALSVLDIHAQSHQDGSLETFPVSAPSTSSGKSFGGFGSIRKLKWRNDSEGDDSTSVRSYAPSLEVGGDAESLLGDVLEASQWSPAWKLLGSQVERPDPFDSMSYEDNTITADFDQEFDELRELKSERENEGMSQLNFIMLLLNRFGRGTSIALEIKKETLSHSFVRRKAHL